VNQGTVSATGLEVVADATLGALALGGGGTLQRARGRDADGAAIELEYEPAVHGNLWAEAPLPARARLAVELSGTGAQRYIDLDTGTISSLPRSLQAGLRLSREFPLGGAGPWRRLDVALAVENLADRAIYDQAGLPQPGRTLRIMGRLW
jgi:hypothetical protein